MMSEKKTSTNLPIEVKLVNDVKTCRTCKWFWGGIPPYGPYPSYNWNETFPEAARKQLPQETGPMDPIKWMKVRVEGYHLVDPAVMHGCRKAPIMTIGINPNLTSYFASTSGARWAYPYFDEDAKYAYYYRHQTIFQESLDLKLIREHIKPGTEVIAEKPGWIKDAARCTDHRWLLLTVQYEGDEEETQIELAWTPEARYVLFFDRSYKTGGKPDFKKGDIIAGMLEAPKDIQTDIYENATAYYQRFLNVLNKFKEMAGGELAQANLRIGEDVEQHDMIACASPGWSSTYDIPTERITDNCVLNHDFVVSQFIRSQPKLLVIVGGSSLDMFARVFAPYMDLDWKDKDIYQLLKETTERKRYLTIDMGGISFKTRIITCPHFSYYQNFVEQARFSPEAWEAFKKDFESDYKILVEEKRVQPPAYNGVVALRIEGKDDEIKKRITASGWGVIMAYYYDPFEMMASVLLDMYRAGELTYDKKTGHLSRAQGSCHYCVNDLWQFPEGCPYEKDKEKPDEPGKLEQVVEKILEQARKIEKEKMEKEEQ
jgi:hypothetical protein